MRLVELDDQGDCRLTKDYIDNIPPYAILSHTWGRDTDEVTFKDLIEKTCQWKPGYDKIQFCGKEAKSDGLQYFWIDTCCIDKSNNAELSEAINSMFRWYREASKCYVYLSDVSVPGPQVYDASSRQLWESCFRKSRWFTRGWTLQELLAPKSVEFFSKEGYKLGDKVSLEQCIHEITGIPIKALQGNVLADFSVAERMSWAESRTTTRKEDKAYSLLGIFDIYMPLIYGEGDAALKRLRKEIQHQAEEILPSVGQAISDLSFEPFRRVSMTIQPETLPEDPDSVLEIRLQIDNLLKGRMSFFIAYYQEERTWPKSFGLRNRDYTEYYLSLQARLDIQFRWFDKVVALDPAYGTEALVDGPELFSMTLDGEEFKPKVGLGLPQVFEIPSLCSLIQNRNRFEFIMHNLSTGAESLVPEKTDISIELTGDLEKDRIQLFRSHTTREQQDLLSSPYLSTPGMSPILRTALLARYIDVTGLGKSDNYGKPKIIDISSLNNSTFNSIKERLKAACHYYKYAQEINLKHSWWHDVNSPYGKAELPVPMASSRPNGSQLGVQAQALVSYILQESTAQDHAYSREMNFTKTRWQNAYWAYEQVVEILTPIVLSRAPNRPPPIAQATALIYSLRQMCTIWQRQKKFKDADFVSRHLVQLAELIQVSDPEEADFKRLWADSLLQRAEVKAELGDTHTTIECLRQHVHLLHTLYLKFPTESRQLAWLQSLLAAVKLVSNKSIVANRDIGTWKVALRSATNNDELFEQVAHPLTSIELPIWLRLVSESWTPQQWPTKLVKNTTLRYSVRIPEKWSADCQVRNTSSMTTHIYNGKYDAEYLMISTMEDEDEHGEIRHLVDMAMAVSWFPVICDLKTQPTMMPDSWQYLGEFPNLATRVNADVAYGYMGVVEYFPRPAMLGRIYVLLVRKQRRSWQITLGLRTTCMPDTPEEILNATDHNRAGATFGHLQLGDI